MGGGASKTKPAPISAPVVQGGRDNSKSVRIVLVVGWPGVDTASQCMRLADKFGGVALCTSALMRAELDSLTDTGSTIAEMVLQGKVVPAHLTIKMISAATAQQPGKTFLLEGFPRTLDALGLFEKTFGACQRALVFDPSDASTPEDQALRRQLRAFTGDRPFRWYRRSSGVDWFTRSVLVVAMPMRSSKPHARRTQIHR